MANKSNGVFANAIDTIVQNAPQILEDVAKQCKDKMEKDFAQKAKAVVDHYYESYEPVWYKREGHLHDIYHVESRMRHQGNRIIITAEAVFDSAPLDGVYHSFSQYHQGQGAWGDGGQVEGEWVFYQFLAGAHPYYDPANGYSPIMDDISPKDSLNQYSKRYGTVYLDSYFNELVMDRFNAIINSAKI